MITEPRGSVEDVAKHWGRAAGCADGWLGKIKLSQVNERQAGRGRDGE